MANSEQLRIALIFGGVSPEHEVSISSAITSARALKNTNHLLLPLYIKKEGQWLFAPRFFSCTDEQEHIEEFFHSLKAPPTNQTTQAFPICEALPQLKRLKVQVALLLLHGPNGEDGTIQALLEALAIPYTGSGVESSSLAMNKVRTQAVLHGMGIPVADHLFYELKPGVRFETIGREVSRNLHFPVVVKPARGGSSVGISIAKDHPQLRDALALARRYDPLVLIEKYLAGTEVTCGILDKVSRNGRVRTLALAPTQIIPREDPFFDYQAKYIPGRCEETTPAPFPAQILKSIRATALRAHQLLGCAGMSRTDMVLVNEVPYVLDVNTIPGMTPTSLLPQGARAIGISFSQVLEHIIHQALWRARHRTPLAL